MNDFEIDDKDDGGHTGAYNENFTTSGENLQITLP